MDSFLKRLKNYIAPKVGLIENCWYYDICCCNIKTYKCLIDNARMIYLKKNSIILPKKNYLKHEKKEINER